MSGRFTCQHERFLCLPSSTAISIWGAMQHVHIDEVCIMCPASARWQLESVQAEFNSACGKQTALDQGRVLHGLAGVYCGTVATNGLRPPQLAAQVFPLSRLGRGGSLSSDRSLARWAHRWNSRAGWATPSSSICTHAFLQALCPTGGPADRRESLRRMNVDC